MVEVSKLKIENEKKVTIEEKSNVLSPETLNLYQEASKLTTKLKANNASVVGQLTLFLSNTSLSDKQKQQLVMGATKNLSDESVLNRYNSELAKKFSENEILELTDLHQSELLKKVSQREDELLSSRGEDLLNGFIKEKVGYLSTRSELIKSLDREHKIYEDVSKLYELAMEPYRIDGFKKFGQSAEMQRRIEEQLRRALRESYLSGLIYTVQDLDDEELTSFFNLSSTTVLKKKDSYWLTFMAKL